MWVGDEAVMELVAHDRGARFDDDVPPVAIGDPDLTVRRVGIQRRSFGPGYLSSRTLEFSAARVLGNVVVGRAAKLSRN